MNHAGRYERCSNSNNTLKARALNCVEEILVFVLKPIARHSKAIKLFVLDMSVFVFSSFYLYIVWNRINQHPMWSIVAAIFLGAFICHYIHRRDN